MTVTRVVAGCAKSLLIELGTEELPPKALKKLSEAFSQSLFSGLQDSGLVADTSKDFKCFATPRRLAVHIKNVSAKQIDLVEEIRGPAIQAAYDADGKPTKAAEGFARSCEVPLSKLTTAKTDKGEWLVFARKVKGKKLNEIVTDCLEQSIRALPIPKRMRWGEVEHEFVRPAHWLLALYGNDLLKTSVLGLASNRFTYGHRFHSPGKIRIPSADRYVNILKASGYVI